MLFSTPVGAGIILIVGMVCAGGILMHPFEPAYSTVYIPQDARVASHLFAARRALSVDTYDIEKAERELRNVLKIDTTNYYALYNLSRVLLVRGAYEDSLRLATQARALYPSDTKSLYVASLAAAYDGDVSAAETYMYEYIAQDTDASWQSRLDLAWTLFRQGSYAHAATVLEDAREHFGSNAWIEVSLGGAYVAQGMRERALHVLEQARVSVAAVTPDIWQENYRYNDPHVAKEGIADLARVIDLNTQIARGALITKDLVPSRFVSGVTPTETVLGIVVSACGESCVSLYGATCTAANVCGVSGVGTIGCSGSCEVTAGLPQDFGQGCTVSTPCGPAAGRINCNGQCNVSRYNTCPGVLIMGNESDEEFDEFGNPVPKYGCAAAKVKIKALPLLVRKGKVSAIQWVANEAVSCTVSGGGQTWSGLQGVQMTDPIQETTKFTVTCQPMAQCTGQQALPFSANVEVKVVPDWQEI